MEEPGTGIGDPRPIGSAVEGLAGGLLRSGYRTVRRLLETGKLLFRRGWILAGLAETVAAEQEDFGVLHQTIGNRGRDGGVEEDVAPIGKRSVGGDDGGTFLAVASRD